MQTRPPCSGSQPARASRRGTYSFPSRLGDRLHRRGTQRGIRGRESAKPGIEERADHGRAGLPATSSRETFRHRAGTALDARRLVRNLRTLSPRAQIAAHLHLAAEPARARLDEFLPRRRTDQFRRVRRLLSLGPRLDQGRRGVGAYRRHRCRAGKPDPGRGAGRRAAVEARAGRARHRHDRRLGPDPCGHSELSARVRGRGAAWPLGRGHHAGHRGHQPRAGRPARDVGAHGT